MRSAQIIFAIAAVFFNQSVIAQGQGKGPPTVDVNVINTPDVNVVSMPTPATTVVCVLDAGGGGSSSPYSGGGSGGISQTQLTCPIGVDRINVQRIAFSPEYEFSLKVVKFRATVGFNTSASASFFDPAGFLAILTDGAPQATVAQAFILDTTDPIVSLYYRIVVFSGLDGESVERDGAFFFIGTPVP